MIKTKIYKSWSSCIGRFFYIEETFNDNGYEANLYNATLKTMCYIGRYIHFDKSLKKDLKEVREFYLENKL